MGTALPKTNGPPALVEVSGEIALGGGKIGIDGPKGEAAAAVEWPLCAGVDSSAAALSASGAEGFC
jgi:hypothetical protein